jgi:hypothetical protein
LDLKTYKLILDKVNQDVLVKKLNHQKMNKKETKRLHRTKRIIEKSYIKVQVNIKNEEKFNNIFF